MKAAIKRGFTIVELLVVITIIGILMAMLFPALNAARIAARRVQCLNRQRQVGQGIITYSTPKDLYPGWKMKIKKDDGSFFDANWVVRILPNIEQAALYEQIRNDSSLAPPRIEALICPANPPNSKSDPVLGYVVNCGSPGGEALANKGDGVFFDRGQGASNPVKMRPTFISGADGLTNTLLLSENVYHKPWDSANLPEASVGLMWEGTGTEAIGSLRSGDKDQAHKVPSSKHPGVCIMTFCDGHTRAISENIQYSIYKALMTSDGKETILETDLNP